MILHKKDNFLVKKGLPQCVTCLRNFTNSIFQEFYNFIGNRSSDFTVNNVVKEQVFLEKRVCAEWHTWILTFGICLFENHMFKTNLINNTNTVKTLLPFSLIIIMFFSPDIYKKHACHVSSLSCLYKFTFKKWNWRFALPFLNERRIFIKMEKKKLKKLYNYFLIMRNICQFFQI